ncbi:hypothetical protein ACNAUY_07865 [Acinetobacter tibetensis]|uniref:hypothetical protein n=1 Tax=Acinetobacter tibetensis TaxID=2943497 RepID=UPI003A4D75DE
MNKLFVFIKSLFGPMSVASVMINFNKQVKQLEDVARQQRDEQAKHALTVQKALAKQSEAEAEEAAARHAAEAIKNLIQKPKTQTLTDLKKELN